MKMIFINIKLKNHGGDKMPGFDRTGPFGWGPMTGRGMGYCGGGRGSRCFGRFGGLKRRFRAFWRTPFFGAASSKEETEWLKEEAEILRRELEVVERRLTELEKEKKD